MAITTVSVIGNPVQTCKPDEVVIVQVVDVNGQLRLEGRIWCDNDRYTGPTKQVVSLCDPSAVRDLIATLTTAADEFDALVATQKPAASAPVKKSGFPTPTVTVNGNGVAARKVRAARKAS